MTINKDPADETLSVGKPNVCDKILFQVSEVWIKTCLLRTSTPCTILKLFFWIKNLSVLLGLNTCYSAPITKLKKRFLLFQVVLVLRNCVDCHQNDQVGWQRCTPANEWTHYSPKHL